MLYSKITYGHVVQIFNDQGQCISQLFYAGDIVEYEAGDSISGFIEINREQMPFQGSEYYPFEMVQPVQILNPEKDI